MKLTDEIKDKLVEITGLSKFGVCFEAMPEKKIKQMLENQEKAEKWDLTFGNPNNTLIDIEYVKKLEQDNNNFKVGRNIILQENKQLKEKAEFKHKLALHNEKEFVNRVQKLEKIKEVANRNEVKTGYNAYDKIDIINEILEK